MSKIKIFPMSYSGLKFFPNLVYDGHYYTSDSTFIKFMEVSKDSYYLTAYEYNAIIEYDDIYFSNESDCQDFIDDYIMRYIENIEMNIMQIKLIGEEL